jgi:hypothetical protein
MTSTISNYSSLIDIGYPVAGADNDTQGFRDHDTKIVQSLNIAASEISSLQDSALTLQYDLSAMATYRTTLPATQFGATGDKQGTIISTVTNNIATVYMCTANYTDGQSPIWIQFTATNIVF